MGSLRDAAKQSRGFNDPSKAFRGIFDDPRLCNAEVACEFLGLPYTGPWISPDGVSPVPHLHLNLSIFKYGSHYRLKFFARKHIRTRDGYRWGGLVTAGEYTYKKEFHEDEWDDMWDILKVWSEEVHVYARKEPEERKLWFAVLNFPTDWIVHEGSVDPAILISTVER